MGEIAGMRRTFLSAHRMICGASYLLVAIQFATGCSDCNREGCEALKTKAEQFGAGVAGVIAGESDMVVNGCADCEFSSAMIEIWPTDSAPTDDEQARNITQSEAPALTLSSSRSFTQPLDPGHYLFCVGLSCVPIEVVDRTITVNLKRREGPTSFFTESAPGSALAETFGFDIGDSG